jgi:2-amino-4-hydroxy-6-hydroxymethyldihydropteridine diphosphokinase
VKLLIIGLGSNLGLRMKNLNEAAKRLSVAFGTPVLQSSIYETDPVGVENHPVYLNQVLVFCIQITARDAFQTCLEIEKQMGRTGKGHLLPRLIDIDLLAFGNDIVNERDLVVPHPSLERREFVLAPLAEILPDWEHPVLLRKASELLAELKRNSHSKGITPILPS